MSERPLLSVIVPVHNAGSLLTDTLGALGRSDLPRAKWELVVVDDGSSDDSADIAGRYADTVVRLGGRARGPAYARNRGAEASRGEVLVFLDADVRVAPDALRKIATLFESDRTLGAAFGSYDGQPSAPGLVSRYRNLLHHYHHVRNAGEAETFWAGLGGVRTEVFNRVGGFDEERYARPQIEDIELGRRIRRAGHRILLDPTIQGTHLKRWTLAKVVQTDLLHRGIPWTRLLLSEAGRGEALNVSPREKLCVALVGAAILAGGVGLATGRWVWLLATAGLLALVVVLNIELYRYLARGRGVRFAGSVIPLHLLYYLTSGLAYAIGNVVHRLDRTRPRSTTPSSLHAGHDDA